MDKISTWIKEHSGAVGKMLSVAILVVGILLIIGAIMDWDWIYKPDNNYHNRWNTGQISRYLGRGTARVFGFAVGLLLVIAGGAWTYMAFFRKS
ncbi:MAG: immunity 17 family protein [Chitinophagaceae bacterium]|nr:immunity 17 family protein [Chitinophagaceae bacterium]MBL0057147.1 immunity 17 family protein [Chitinophagaceae bacterium]